MARRGGRERCPYDGKTTFKNWRKGQHTARRLVEGTRLYWCPPAGGWHITGLELGEYDKRMSKGLKGQLEKQINLRRRKRKDRNATSCPLSCVPPTRWLP